MMRVPDGHGRLELARYVTPAAHAATRPHNTLGVHRVMFAVDDIDAVLERLRAHGTELVGGVARYEDSYRLCYVRALGGVMIALAQQRQ